MSVKRPARGISLIEVMVTLAVISVGLLGVVKMQAAAIASTQSARTRSLVALQAGSLASAMRANPGYWGSASLVATSFSASGTTITDASGVLTATPPDCTTATCTVQQLAAYDLQNWAASMNQHFPSYQASGTCDNTASVPVRCSLTITWREKQLAINASTAASASDALPASYTLLVQP